MRFFPWLALVALATIGFATAQSPDEYRYQDSRGNSVLIPWGRISFADRLISYAPGQPAPRVPQEGERAIGPPDGRGGVVSLGCGGEIVLGFDDNVVMNVAGPDLYIFEQGRASEAMNVAISANSRSGPWIDVGIVDGATATIDLDRARIPTTSEFRFIRLIDQRTACGAGTPGADLNAVGVIGAGPTVTIPLSDVHFNTNEASLKAEESAVLARVIEQIRTTAPQRVFVVGHTDDQGSHEHNQTLSAQRAEAVRAVLAERLTVPLETFAYGETIPVVSNTTEHGRSLNRRVEILLIPAASNNR